MLHLLVAEFGILYFYNKTLSNKMAYPEFCFFLEKVQEDQQNNIKLKKKLQTIFVYAS